MDQNFIIDAIESADGYDKLRFKVVDDAEFESYKENAGSFTNIAYPNGCYRDARFPDDVIVADLKDGCMTLVSNKPFKIGDLLYETFARMCYREIDLSEMQIKPYETVAMFEGCENLEVIHFGDIDTTDTWDMERMFENCERLREVNLEALDTSGVSNFARMFKRCESMEKLDLRALNTENAQYMNDMFRGCLCLKHLDVSSFNTNGVYTMRKMFACCEDLEELDISNFDFSNIWVEDGKVKGMEGMFDRCHSLKLVKVHTDREDVREELIHQLGDRVQFV